KGGRKTPKSKRRGRKTGPSVPAWVGTLRGRPGKASDLVTQSLDVVDGFSRGDDLVGLRRVEAADVDHADAISHAHHLSLRRQQLRLPRRQVVDAQVDGRALLAEGNGGEHREPAAGVDERRDHAAVQ